ncbi:hypothetical protein LMG28688_07152 [Paraburkholderia caffeinitolerans]|uniref:Uncharacterized protein n=1 Tax=Paraburkholderia caffeinitolerans TaxID=1723730 RepID=A0A6J5H708_9BURK|nr:MULTISPECIES: hypothetical protein [Paraburkholderia]CAB3810098.1 hypothetical protein LMG28688_07152 [Paraburkholderia caffeinitolerans]
MSLGENVRHIRQLLGWSRSDMLRRLAPHASGRERARISQQVYQLERRASRRSDLLLSISEVFGIAPNILLNHDLTGLTLAEVKLLRPDADAPMPGELLALTSRFAAASDEARVIIDKVFAVDRDYPQLIGKLLIMVDVFLDGRVPRRGRGRIAE